MPRKARKAPGGVIFHCINRGVGGMRLFRKPQDYAAFEQVMAHALEAVPIRLLAYSVMPDHWHLLLWPTQSGQLAKFMHRLTMTHTRRYQEHRREVGSGHLYQGRFKSFPVQEDRHLLVVAQYIEGNALRSGLVERAEQWPWCSLWRRTHHGLPVLPRAKVIERGELFLSPWPVNRSSDYLRRVNQPPAATDEEAVRLSVTKGRPFGDAAWQARITKRLGLESSFRPTGRPRKSTPEAISGG